MPPKRKLRSSTIPSNAASAAAYTDVSGSASNKRSKLSKPAAKPKVNGSVKREDSDNSNDGQVKAESPSFDHSRPEERVGIVDRRFYPAEMSNERCAMYNANEIPRPIELLNLALADTQTAREAIRKGDAGDAVVHWFKRDLRVADNTALAEAARLAKEKNVGIIGVWILSPEDWEAHLVSPAKCDFELRSVAHLQSSLKELNIPLYTEAIASRKAIPDRLIALVKEWNASSIFCNLEYEPDELRRETRILRAATAAGINFEPYHDDCVIPPGTLKSGSGKQYAVYSPWLRAWIAHLHAHPHLLNQRPAPTPNPSPFAEKFQHLFDQQLPDMPDSKSLAEEERERLHALWPAGEAAALDRIGHFLNTKIGKYIATRNFPAQKSTSRVSVHHAAGTLAARTSVRMARDVNSTKKLDGGNEGIRGWIGEVAWRDFYRHVLVNWPYVW